jgi:hypothetical protein
MLNPLNLRKNAFNEILMLPAGFIAIFYGMLEYQIWSQGNVDYICKEAHMSGLLTGMLFSLRYLK